jgi:hypothetical protein
MQSPRDWAVIAKALCSRPLRIAIQSQDIISLPPCKGDVIDVLSTHNTVKANGMFLLQRNGLAHDAVQQGAFNIGLQY